MTGFFGGIYRGKKVLVTGHTGFKGSWLALFLEKLGADVAGYSLPPNTEPSHFKLLGLASKSCLGDIRDASKLELAIAAHRPEIVFHLAAQPLVIESYRNPLETFSTNIQGTANLLEICRRTDSVRAVINVTSDKCYRNTGGRIRKFREDDPLGGKDPYSASKACSEIVAEAYRNLVCGGDGGGYLLASARAGNVIGGGDWAAHRLFPDIARTVAAGSSLEIRFPDATRPFQHVLDVLAGYLLIGQRLLEGRKEFAEAWNIGPGKSIKVRRLLEIAVAAWPALKNADIRLAPEPPALQEAESLELDCRKAASTLGYSNIWPVALAVKKTVKWYRNFQEDRKVGSGRDLEDFLSDAARKNTIWAGNT